MIEWQTIPRYPDYEASSEGHIRRKRDRYNSAKPGAILSENPGKKGYLRACVNNYTQAVAPLICEAFHGRKPSPAYQAAHRNGVNTDNRSTNLAWLTQPDNYKDSVRHGTHRKGVRCGHAKLSEADVLLIRELARKQPKAELAKKFNISPTAISRITLRQSWTHI